MPSRIIPLTDSNWRALASGPRSTLGSQGSPTVSSWQVLAASASTCDMSARGTSSRDGALQLWPLFDIILRVPCSTARSSGASGSRRFADFPPSSSDTRLMDAAAARETLAPARVEPVRDTMSTSG